LSPSLVLSKIHNPLKICVATTESVGETDSQTMTSFNADLQSSDGSTLETQIGLEVLGDLSHQTLEGQLADQQLGGLLITTDLTQSHGTGPGEMSGGTGKNK